MELIANGFLYRRFAIEMLGKAGPAAAETIPVLREVMIKHGFNEEEKDEARRALKRIESKPVPCKTGPEPFGRSEKARPHLKSINPESVQMSSALEELTEG